MSAGRAKAIPTRVGMRCAGSGDESKSAAGSLRYGVTTNGQRMGTSEKRVDGGICGFGGDGQKRRLAACATGENVTR